jgi:hypothetical protein
MFYIGVFPIPEPISRIVMEALFKTLIENISGWDKLDQDAISF